MPISEVVKAWSRENNTRTGATRWMVTLLAVILVSVCVPQLIEGYTPQFVLVAVLAVFAWYTFAPKAVGLGQLRSSIYRDSFVPDSLLAKIADSNDVPASIKSELADRLRKDGRISFGLLFELECWIASKAERAKVEQGSGYRKMMAYKGQDGE